MLPEYLYILCQSCHRRTEKLSRDAEELLCKCGQMIKNPYYKEKKIITEDNQNGIS